jgi:hypothetical protein
MRGQKEYPPAWDNEPDENAAEDLAYLEWIDAKMSEYEPEPDDDFEEYDEATCVICDSRSHRNCEEGW